MGSTRETYSPASRDIPSLEARTHELLQTPQTSLSLPSFVQPCFEAATASMDDGLFEYVVNWYVDNRERNDESDDGRYSDTAAAELDATEMLAICGGLNGIIFRAFREVRSKIAASLGAFSLTMSLELGLMLRKRR